jgi:formylglycine-generating enzyme required for sulfatase activity
MWSGSSKASEVLWAYANTGGQNQKVAKLKPNELGIYDMSGNVCEMCYYNGPYEKNKEPVVDPQGPNHGEEFVYRGGHCGLDFSSPWFCRVSAREGYMSDRNTRGLGESWVIGLRLVMKPKSK